MFWGELPGTLRGDIMTEHKCPYCGKWVVNGVFHAINHESYCEGLPAVILPPESEVPALSKEVWDNNLKRDTIKEYMEKLENNMSSEFHKHWLEALKDYVNRK